MKAVVIRAYGGPEELKFEERPDPIAEPGDVLVRVAATSVNPFDIKLRSGQMKEFFPLTFPAILGVDVAGIVETVGPGVQNFAPGDNVFANAVHTYASLCAVSSRPRQHPQSNGHHRGRRLTHRYHEWRTTGGAGHPRKTAWNRSCHGGCWQRRAFGSICAQAGRLGRHCRGAKEANRRDESYRSGSRDRARRRGGDEIARTVGCGCRHHFRAERQPAYWQSEERRGLCLRARVPEQRRGSSGRKNRDHGGKKGPSHTGPHGRSGKGGKFQIPIGQRLADASKAHLAAEKGVAGRLLLLV